MSTARNAHDISSVVAAFATIEYAHKSLFKALQRRPDDQQFDQIPNGPNAIWTSCFEAS
jgi:hypothetical protein